VGGAQPNDSLFFHCELESGISTRRWTQTCFAVSGHGGQTKDMDKDEVDGYDEGVPALLFVCPPTIHSCIRQVIYPCDYETAGHLVDDVRPWLT
jgi:hypothetical protein